SLLRCCQANFPYQRRTVHLETNTPIIQGLRARAPRMWLLIIRPKNEFLKQRPSQDFEIQHRRMRACIGVIVVQNCRKLLHSENPSSKSVHLSEAGNTGLDGVPVEVIWRKVVEGHACDLHVWTVWFRT